MQQKRNWEYVGAARTLTRWVKKKGKVSSEAWTTVYVFGVDWIEVASADMELTEVGWAGATWTEPASIPA